MRIIPVIDLMGGVVVRGVGGRRDEYRPIRSQIADKPTPVAVASAFRRLGYDTVYVADIDAIQGKGRDWNAYQQIARAGLKLWIDGGIRQPEDADEMLAFDRSGKSLDGIVVGSETVSDADAYALIEARLKNRMVFSLDTRNGIVLSPLWQNVPAIDVAKEVLKQGTRRLIVLDLTRVGEGQGAGTEALCHQIREVDAGVEIIAGGGVRGQQDLDSLAAAGCNVALVASALHDGRL